MRPSTAQSRKHSSSATDQFRRSNHYQLSEDNMSATARRVSTGSLRSPTSGGVPDIIDRKDLSSSEENNLVRLFNTFAVEVELSESDADLEHSQRAPTGAAAIRVLEYAELRNLLGCIGLKLDDDSFDRLVAPLRPRHPNELTFEEFVTFMVRSNDLRRMRDDLQKAEREHVSQYSHDRFPADSTWRWFWDVMVILVTGYFNMIVTYEWTQANPQPTTLIVLDGIFSALLILDIFVYGNTVKTDPSGKPIDSLRGCFEFYAKRNLLFDVLGSIPLDFVLTLIWLDDHNQRTAWFVFRATRLVRNVRVPTLFSGVSVHGFLSPTFVYLQYTIAPVLKALFYFVLVVHCLTIGWMVTVRLTDGEDDEQATNYIDGIYLVLYSLSTVGFGDLSVSPGGQRIYCCFLFLGGVVMNGLVISQMSVFLSKADIQSDRKDKMRETLAVLSHFDIPVETQSEILSFQHHVLSHNLGSSHEELMGSLPETIQDSLGLFMRIKFINMVPMFANSARDTQEALAMTLENIVFHPQEFILVAGEIGNEMYFLGHGAADVIGPGGVHFATIRKGGFFGEIALLVDGARRNASIKALTYCDTFRLKRNQFMRILHKFPEFREILEREVADRVAKFKASQTKEEKSGKGKKKRKEKTTSGGDSTINGAELMLGATAATGVFDETAHQHQSLGVESVQDLPAFDEAVASATLGGPLNNPGGLLNATNPMMQTSATTYEQTRQPLSALRRPPIAEYVEPSPRRQGRVNFSRPGEPTLSPATSNARRASFNTRTSIGNGSASFSPTTNTLAISNADLETLNTIVERLNQNSRRVSFPAPPRPLRAGHSTTSPPVIPRPGDIRGRGTSTDVHCTTSPTSGKGDGGSKGLANRDLASFLPGTVEEVDSDAERGSSPRQTEVAVAAAGTASSVATSVDAPRSASAGASVALPEPTTVPMPHISGAGGDSPPTVLSGADGQPDSNVRLTSSQRAN